MLKIEPWTALVMVAGIAGVVLMAYLKVEVTTLAAYSSAAIALAAALRQLAKSPDVAHDSGRGTARLGPAQKGKAWLGAKSDTDVARDK
jgi:hypothetical protein